MSDNVRLVLKNIALKIITAGAFTAKVTISRDNLGHKCQGTHHLNVM